MGSTVLIFKIKPKEDFTSKQVIDEIKTAKKGRCTDAKEVPLGFGIVLVKAVFMVAEKQDSAVNELTEELQKMKAVEEVELEGMTLA